MTHATSDVTGETSTQHDNELAECIQECTSCHAICLKTIQHCLEKGGRHAEPNHIRLLTDCAQICHTSADFMLRQSPLHAHTCGACAAVCRDCAAECAKMGDDHLMKQCADACRRCAESCEHMSSHTH